MALVSGGRSTLNPDAPLFIPAAYRQVEDFSPEWWQLVTTSQWYRDYWLSQHQDEEGFYDENNEFGSNDVVDLLPDTFDFDAGDDFSVLEVQFEEFVQSYEAEVENRSLPLSSNGMHKDGFGMEEETSLSKLGQFSPPSVNGKPKSSP